MPAWLNNLLRRLPKLAREIVPYPRPEWTVNPRSAFGLYQEQISALDEGLRAATHPVRYVHDTVEKLLENDVTRKESIEKRAEALLVLNGAVAAIFVPMDSKVALAVGDQGILGRAWLFVVLLGLIYSVVSFAVTLAIYRRIPRHVLSFDELVGEQGLLTQNARTIEIAKLVVENWKINNRWAERLETARRYFRNALVLLFGSVAFAVAGKILGFFPNVPL